VKKMTDRQVLDGTLHGQYAGFISRFVAFWIDQLIVGGALAVFSMLVGFVLQEVRIDQWLGIGPLPPASVAALAAAAAVLLDLVYCVAFWLLAGRTPGKQAMGLLLVRTDGQRIRFGSALLRWLGYYLSAILFLGYLWILVDDRRQALHDKLAGTMVVYSRPKETGLTAPTPIRDRLRDDRRRREGAQEPN
jgi:uncharacterized RDD family membrane protein YckC